MLELKEELKPFTNNFKINVFDYHNYKDFNMFQTENRLLFEMLSCGKDKKKMLLLLGQKEYEQLDAESTKAILGIMGVKIPLEKIKKIGK